MANDVRRALFECRNVDIGIESRVLVRGLNLSVEAGSILVVLGPNGCGKSLSLHTFAGLRAPQAGGALFQDRPIFPRPPPGPARELALLSANVQVPAPPHGRRPRGLCPPPRQRRLRLE